MPPAKRTGMSRTLILTTIIHRRVVLAATELVNKQQRFNELTAATCLHVLLHNRHGAGHVVDDIGANAAHQCPARSSKNGASKDSVSDSLIRKSLVPERFRSSDSEIEAFTSWACSTLYSRLPCSSVEPGRLLHTASLQGRHRIFSQRLQSMIMQFQQISNQLTNSNFQGKGGTRTEYWKCAYEMKNDPYPSLMCDLSKYLDCLLVRRHTVCLGDIWELSQRDECWNHQNRKSMVNRHDFMRHIRSNFEPSKNRGEEMTSLTRTTLFPEMNCALFILVGAVHMDKYEFITAPGKVRCRPSQSCFAAWREVHRNTNVPPSHVYPQWSGTTQQVLVFQTAMAKKDKEVSAMVFPTAGQVVK